MIPHQGQIISARVFWCVCMGLNVILEVCIVFADTEGNFREGIEILGDSFTISSAWMDLLEVSPFFLLVKN